MQLAKFHSSQVKQAFAVPTVDRVSNSEKMALCAKSTASLKGSAVRGAALRPRVAARRFVLISSDYSVVLG